MSTTSCNNVGRPRAFDVNTALEKALEVFWLKGYEGTSLSDLTEAMGINKPSLYSAFGNKEQLFLKAIELYENRPTSFFHPALLQPTAFKVAEYMLFGAAESLVNKNHPQGCLVVQGALNCRETADTVKQELQARRKAHEDLLLQRFEKAKAEDDLPPRANAKALSDYLITILNGMCLQSTNGANKEQLEQVASLALEAFTQYN